MSDDTKNSGAQDRARINVNEPYELSYWSKKFGCTADELRAAVKQVGVMSADVERHLKG